MWKKKKVEYSITKAIMGRARVYVDSMDILYDTFVFWNKNLHCSFVVPRGCTIEQFTLRDTLMTLTLGKKPYL